MIEIVMKDGKRIGDHELLTNYDEQMERVFKCMERYAESCKGYDEFNRAHGLMTYDDIMNYVAEQRKKWYGEES